MGAAKEARDGLEELASAPHREASEAHIWVLKGRRRVQERLEEIVHAARSELLVAGTAEHILAFSEIWKRAKSRRIKVVFATAEPGKISALSKYGQIASPSHDIKLHESDPPKVMFVRADRKTILFASEYEEGSQIEDMMAFWTDDPSVVRFMNYLTDSMTPRNRSSRSSA